MVRDKEDSTVFDQVAAEYDSSFSQTDLGRMLRSRVWRHLREQFRSGQGLLDIACGTGEDARWLAQQGIHITALDGSLEMVRIATRKAEKHGYQGEIIVKQCSLQEIIDQPRSIMAYRTEFGALSVAKTSPGSESNEPKQFDGALCNFGGMNVIDSWNGLAKALAHLVRTGGKIVLVPMGPFCPWEIGWYLAHGRPRTAFRRFAKMPLAKIGNRDIPIFYPTPAQIRRDFQPWFKVKYSESLGLLLPPTSLPNLVERWPRIFRWLNSIEQRTGRMTFGWGDHYILVLERNEAISES